MSQSNRKQIHDSQTAHFQTTQWADIAMAQMDNDAIRRKAIDALANRYWRPVYCFLRWKGHDAEDALDLTQGFFQEIVLGRELFREADRSRGRFRSFLLAALTHYLSSQHRKDRARKRRPQHQTVDLETLELQGLVPFETHTDPDRVFAYVWATELMDRVLAELETEYQQIDRHAHWAAFHERLVGPIIDGRAVPSLAEICAKHGIESEKVASNMIITVKRRFRAILLRRLGETLRSGSDVEEELCEFISILSNTGAA